MKYLLLLLLFASCTSEKAKSIDGKILIDPNTQTKYLLQSRGGEIFIVSEYVMSIVDGDTTYKFIPTSQFK